MRLNYVKWKIYHLNPVMPISKLSLSLLISNFLNKIAYKFPSDIKFRIQVQYKSDYNIKSLCYIQILDKTTESKETFENITHKYLELYENQYSDLVVDNLYIRYIFLKEKIPPLLLMIN